MKSNIITLEDSRFSLGALVATPAAIEVVSSEKIAESLQRHVTGDWGEVCDEDRLTNDLALQNGGRLMSVYQTADQTKFWIITEADHSVTTVLLPRDY